MLKIILISLAAVILVLVIVIATRPADFRVVRTATIDAPAPVVFAQVNDFHKWAAWSPWEKIDPEMKRTYSGPDAGVGAKYAWAGNSQIGEGSMTITESRPSERIAMQLEFLKPFAATNTTVFDFKPEGQKTVVTWDMSGHANFAAKAFQLFISMDKMVGGQFEQGLAQLNTASQAAAKP